MERILSTHQVAELLGVSRQRVWAMVKQGQLRPLRLGPRTTVFDAADVKDLIDSRNAAVGSDDGK